MDSNRYSMRKKIGSEIDRLFLLREQKRQLQEQITEINKEYEGIEAELISIMELEQLEKASGTHATATIKIDSYPSVDDLELFTRFVVENERWDMLRKQANAGPIREMLEQQNMLPPGISVYEKAKCLLRKK